MKPFNIGDEVEDTAGHRSFVTGRHIEYNGLEDDMKVNRVIYQTVDAENNYHSYHAYELTQATRKGKSKSFKFSIGDAVSKINGYPCPIIFEVKDRWMINKCCPYYKIQNIHETIPNNYEYVPESALKNENRAWTSSVVMHHMCNNVNVADMYPKNGKLYLEPKFKVGDIVADVYLGIVVKVSPNGYYVRFGSPVNDTEFYGLSNKALHIPADYEVDKWIKRTFKYDEVCRNPADIEESTGTCPICGRDVCGCYDKEPIQDGIYYIRDTGTELDAYQCQILKFDTTGRTKVRIPMFNNLEIWLNNKHLIFKDKYKEL